jgi:hypothetical protein
MGGMGGGLRGVWVVWVLGGLMGVRRAGRCHVSCVIIIDTIIQTNYTIHLYDAYIIIHTGVLLQTYCTVCPADV